jgi:tRNA pseudouridine38-40 synthase
MILRYFIHLNYNGTAYFGWQVQPGQITVQEKLETVLSTVLGTDIHVIGCGRTDTGVHARSFFAHFDFEGQIPEGLVLRLNKMLPADIGIFDIVPVRDDINARFNATSRTYKYFIHFKKDVFLADRSYRLHSYNLNLAVMNEAAGVISNYEDFTTFEKKGGSNKTSICRITHAEWTVLNENQWCFTITADRFLRNMVRRITGALLMVGMERMSVAEMESALSKHDELEVNVAPPAYGLFLWDVSYPDNIYID